MIESFFTDLARTNPILGTVVVGFIVIIIFGGIALAVVQLIRSMMSED